MSVLISVRTLSVIFCLAAELANAIYDITVISVIEFAMQRYPPSNTFLSTQMFILSDSLMTTRIKLSTCYEYE